MSSSHHTNPTLLSSILLPPTSVAVPGRKTSKKPIKDQLNERDRLTLATQVINATLKALSEAIRNPVRRPREQGKTSARLALRRSNSASSQSPLQPRSLNRAISSPNFAATRETRSPSSASSTSSGYRPSAECARIAFACLRTLSNSASQVAQLPHLQLESGMSTLVGKLITLGMDDLAVKELRILKRRLENSDASKNGPPVRPITTPQTLSDLLDFGEAPFSGPKLALVITTQLQVLRILASARKPKQVEEALEILEPKHLSSPTKLLLLAAKACKDKKQSEKITRQVQTLSEILLSLSPNVSSADDEIAQAAKISVVPEVAVKLQCLALHNRFLWWGLAGHKGDLSKDIFEPFLRCLQAFARRSQVGAEETYRIASSVAKDLEVLLLDCSDSQPHALKSTLGGIYRVLGSLSRDANLVPDAIRWTEHLRRVLDANLDSETRRCAVNARLVSLKFRKAPWDSKDEELLLTLLDGLERPFKGESSEIDELMLEVSSARRFVIAMLSQYTAPSGTSSNDQLSDGLRDMCEQLIFLCPRLCLRYLGNKPDPKQATKDVLRYEQRKQFIAKRAISAVDSSLFLVRLMASQDRSSWELIDAKLQDCLVLLDRLDVDSAEFIFGAGSSPKTYYAKISNLYYTQFLNMKRCAESKDGQQIRALRRSLDSIRTRPQLERQGAHFSTKLERLAEMYKTTGRYDELYKTLCTLQDEMISDGVLSEVVESASHRPIGPSWALNETSTALGRTIQSLIKVQLKYLKNIDQPTLSSESWTLEERGTVLEHHLSVLSNQTESDFTTSLQVRTIQELLFIYSSASFPLRRLRVLLQMVSLELMDAEPLTVYFEELTSLSKSEMTLQGTRDVGLLNFVCHFQALTKTIIELRQTDPDVDIFEQAISTWRSILVQCPTISAFQAKIDSIDNLQNHLNLIASWLQIKGFEIIRVAALRLKADINELYGDSSTPDDLVLSFSRLGDQWLQLGYSGKAGLSLDRAMTYSRRNGVSSYASLVLHLSYCKYLLEIGSLDKVDDHMACAQVLYGKEQDYVEHAHSCSSLEDKTRMNILMSNAYAINSALSLGRGAGHIALSHAKQSVRLLRRAWINLGNGKSLSAPSLAPPPLEMEKLTEDVSRMSVTITDDSILEKKQQTIVGSKFWAMATPLFKSLTHLSNLYAHHGMFQETVYYAEQAYKLAKEIDSASLLSSACVLLGSSWVTAGVLDKGSDFLTHAKQILSDGQPSRQQATLNYQMGKMHGLLGDHKAEGSAYEIAAALIKTLASSEFIHSLERIDNESPSLEKQMASLSITKRKAVVLKGPATRARRIVSRTAAPRAKTPVQVIAPVSEECPQLTSLRSNILRQKARRMMMERKLVDALHLLEEAESYSIAHVDSVDHGFLKAKLLLLQSFEQMHGDSVYSVLQDSTISFPSVIGLAKDKPSDRLSIGRVSPPRKVQLTKTKERITAKGSAHMGFYDKLRQAQDHLIDAHTTGLAIGSVSAVHTVSALLNSVAILLCALNPAGVRQMTSPGMAICSIETARNLSLRREHRAILAEPTTTLKLDESSWPQLTGCGYKRSSFGLANDVTRFQRDYIDIIPKSWTAVSIALSDNCQELSITKMQSGQSPFVLRLPLGRNNSMDADEDVFGFDEGRAELLEILELANESAHDARNRKGKEAKLAWWEEREALDTRLGELLANIEKVWLGGFTGIFSQHSRRTGLLASFQKSFHNILDKHLPSRQKIGRRNPGPRTTLDPRILDLFIGLGDASDEECDFAEPLTDLLYFVVDVLQFHGELNAYAEIDFDAIVVDVQGALYAYHTAVHNSSYTDEAKHTILILDKALHAFPWESLPCMDGLAVSRLPSLGCLRDRIITQTKDEEKNYPEGHYIPRDNGSYMLNPGGDLKDTQFVFQNSMQGLERWQGVVAREPSEEEFKQTLTSKDLLLYFGHGSGAQYIRAREIKRLETCAVTILMGCSSGALVDTGEFEPYGSPINYMHAGCPALVATLWDVTDKDIDRFAMNMLQNWGLLGEKPVKAKGRKKVEVAAERKTSLVEAVAKGRSACHLRYLNAASVVVYGVPVYFK